MKTEKTRFKDLLIIRPVVFEDERGQFFESFNRSRYDFIDNAHWVQDNESISLKGVLRGLHYQTGNFSQAKLVRAVSGEVYDVAVDLRPDSDTYKEWFGIHLSGKNKLQLYIPRGFAHGFLVLSDSAIFSYKCDNYYNKDHEAGIIYNDPSLGIEWPLPDNEIILSEKDKLHQEFITHLSAGDY